MNKQYNCNKSKNQLLNKNYNNWTGKLDVQRQILNLRKKKRPKFLQALSEKKPKPWSKKINV